MIEGLVVNPWYWLAVVLLTVGASVLTRARPLGFRFVVIVLLAQYLVHAAVAFGPGDLVTLFCFGGFAIFVAGSLPVVSELVARRINPLLHGQRFRHFDAFWFHGSRLFLIGYWAARLIAYPATTGDLDLAQRLDAQQQARVLFFLGQVTLPAVAGCMAVWLRRGRRLTWLDLLTVVLTVAALAVSDSKATILPVLLAFFGAMEMSGRRMREFKAFLIPGIALIALALVRLVIFFPGKDPWSIAQTMLYRVAANTDSLEYLKVVGARPQDFPFAGPAALLPYITKWFGFRYDYSPGTWLYGARYGDFSGFGPNSGPVVDYLGNLGIAGLLVVLLAALVLGSLRRIGAAVAVSAASMVYLAFIDVTIFDLPVLFWGAVAAIGVVAVWLPLPRIQLPRRLRRVWRVIDSPLPRVRLNQAPVRHRENRAQTVSR